MFYSCKTFSAAFPFFSSTSLISFFFICSCPAGSDNSFFSSLTHWCHYSSSCFSPVCLQSAWFPTSKDVFQYSLINRWNFCTFSTVSVNLLLSSSRIFLRHPLSHIFITSSSSLLITHSLVLIKAVCIHFCRTKEHVIENTYAPADKLVLKRLVFYSFSIIFSPPRSWYSALTHAHFLSLSVL